MASIPGRRRAAQTSKSQNVKKSKRRQRDAAAIVRRVMMDVSDELHELIRALGCVRELRDAAAAGRAIFEGAAAPRMNGGGGGGGPDQDCGADRIGSAAGELALRAWPAAAAAVPAELDEIHPGDLIDLAAAAETIVASVRLRLWRVTCLIDVSRQRTSDDVMR